MIDIISPPSYEIMSQVIFSNPNLVYEIIKYLDYSDIAEFYRSNSTIYSICKTNPLVRSTIGQKHIILKDYVDDFVKEKYSPACAFRAAAKSGNIIIVNELLRRGSNPASADNSAIIMASENGHVDVVNRLLQDPRVDPSENNNDAIILASGKGHLDVVNRLLQDPRVDPSAKGDLSIIRACEKGHLDVVNRLLQDPSTRNNRVLTEAIKNERFDIVIRLLRLF